uniref:Uncharacterized protein n=1 Tax=Rhizophora mucronata TaxID=61149 RepID=A0A2P2J7D4_RHIMU
MMLNYSTCLKKEDLDISCCIAAGIEFLIMYQYNWYLTL